MYRMGILLSCLWITMFAYSIEMDYMHCYSIQDVIASETKEITSKHFANHDELSELYVSRGESYLFDGQYAKAIEDFEASNYHIGYSSNVKDFMPVAFRAALGKVVSCDNLALHELTQQAVHQLQEIVNNAGCDDCLGDISSSSNQLHFRLETVPLKIIQTYLILSTWIEC